jgi:hypothetical protein
MKKIILISTVAIAIGFGGATTSAAPITCPGSQVATHNAGDQWDCVNPGGNTNESDKEKNDNHRN